MTTLYCALLIGDLDPCDELIHGKNGGLFFLVGGKRKRAANSLLASARSFPAGGEESGGILPAAIQLHGRDGPKRGGGNLTFLPLEEGERQSLRPGRKEKVYGGRKSSTSPFSKEGKEGNAGWEDRQVLENTQ